MNEMLNENNEMVLEAWNQWKKICSILGSPQPYQNILIQKVASAFNQKIQQVTGRPMNILAKAQNVESECEDAEYSRREETDRIFAHEFDCGIIEKARHPGSPLNYKDAVWIKVKESSDPPLKVIHGKLIGPCSTINAIVENYLVRNFNFKWAVSPKKVRYLKAHASLQEPTSGQDGDEAELGNFVEALCTPDEIPDEDKEYVQSKCKETFSSREAATLLAFSADMALTDQLLLDFIGTGSSQCYEIFKQAKIKLQAVLEDLDADDQPKPTAQIILENLFLQLKPEKSASAFLKEVSERINL